MMKVICHVLDVNFVATKSRNDMTGFVMTVMCR